MQNMRKENIWFSSDFHYGHKNLVKGISSWTNPIKCRNFSTLEEHDEILVRNINKVVMENDILYFLGDWSFGNNENIMVFRNKINCRNVHLILGNHDRTLFQKQANFIGKDKFLSISQQKTIKVDDQEITLCHFPMRTWERAGKGSWMLHGHCHGTLEKYQKEIKGFWRKLFSFLITKEYYKTMDVGIDSHPEFRPYSFEAIKGFMENRINLIGIDHHD